MVAPGCNADMAGCCGKLTHSLLGMLAALTLPVELKGVTLPRVGCLC